MVVILNRIDLGLFLFFSPCLFSLKKGRKCRDAVSTGLIFECEFDPDGVVSFGVKAKNVEGLGKNNDLNKLSNLHILSL